MAFTFLLEPVEIETPTYQQQIVIEKTNQYYDNKFICIWDESGMFDNHFVRDCWEYIVVYDMSKKYRRARFRKQNLHNYAVSLYFGTH